MIQDQLDALGAWASEGPHKEELLKAKAEYFAQTGEIFEDDLSYEMRMVSFLDFYLLDRPMGDTGRTPASIFREQSVDLDPGGAKFRQALTETVHSLFEVRKLSKELVRLRDVFTGKDVDVFERRQPAGLRKGDFLEARLLPVDGQWLFSRSFCFHPEEAKKPIFKELKRLKKFEPEFSRPEFIRALSNMRLKLERYRNIAIDDIYDFGRRVP